ncbi:MAG: carbohydrate kinase [Bacteroidetes bacterium HGW-Bacteroidetes-22]|nr:MAG: carbohydrate kinase [Bacteroidetes bacterium HGW-Bacteroidetes-22]
MYILGLDIGSSSIKASILESNTGVCRSSAQAPDTEMEIIAQRAGWAEQDPEQWWHHAKSAIKKAVLKADIEPTDIKAIGISYQMHGLVCVDKDQRVLRNAIIWCDSRAVETGNKAFQQIGSLKCLNHLLNSPGNFTASKLKWVMDHESETAEKIFKIMLPGDFIAMKLTDEISTTISGLSEGIMWDFKEKKTAGFLLNHYGISQDMLPKLTETFGHQGSVTTEAAIATGLAPGTPVCYRAGDQPNNAFSLNVLLPGEVAATAGTSGVVYGVTERTETDPQSRVNTFVHVNSKPEAIRNGVLLCINGTGILNSWVRKIAGEGMSYHAINELAAQVKAGCDGLLVLPFGNGAERMLCNQEINCSWHNLNFNIHSKAHLFRAAQEGIAFAFWYGMQIMQQTGVGIRVIRAGKTNMFQSRIFAETLANISGATIELYNTDGAQGAARGAGVGAGIYTNMEEAFKGLQSVGTIHPANDVDLIKQSYKKWEELLTKNLNKA